MNTCFSSKKRLTLHSDKTVLINFSGKVLKMDGIGSLMKRGVANAIEWIFNDLKFDFQVEILLKRASKVACIMYLMCLLNSNQLYQV